MTNNITTLNPTVAVFATVQKLYYIGIDYPFLIFLFYMNTDIFKYQL